jgi:single-strand DNA-binding protein
MRGGAAVAENDNTITLVGRIGQEPRLRATAKGDVLEFDVATSDRRRAPDGSWSDGPTSWFRVSAWDDLGRHAHASFHRGQQVVVRGVLTVREYQTEGGGRGRAIELRATALGHDLRWGTSTYTDAGRPGAQPSQPRSPVETDGAAGWGPEPETPAPREPAPPRATVPSSAPADWASSLGGVDDVPF